MSKTKKRLLFVCLGNICRSPAAEGVMRKLVDDAALTDEYFIDSAGIGSWHVGQLPDQRMRRCGASRGYDFSSHARQISADDFSCFDLILVMDKENLRIVRGMAPDYDSSQRVRLLASYCTQHPGTTVIPDPYYGDESDFNYALDLVEDACAGLLDNLNKE